MKKKIVSLVLLILMVLLLPNKAITEDDNSLSLEGLIQKQLESLNVDQLENLVNDISSNTEEMFFKIDFSKVITSLIKGEKVFDEEKIITGIFKLIFREVVANSELLAKLLILSIICSVLTNLQSAFEKDTVGEIAFYVCYIILISLSIKSFVIAMQITWNAINNMVILMQTLLPILLVLLVAVGGITSSSLFKPIILGTLSIISTLIRDGILPLVLYSTIIGIICKISSRIQITKISSLIRQISVGIMGISLTIFIGIISIQGATASKVDGVTIRTAKFAVDKFVPIVGKFLSDIMETVVGCSVVLKNAVGAIGMISLFLICIIPIIKILSLILIYKIAGALIEPMTNSRIVDCLSEISKSLVMLLAIVTSVGVMFFIAVTIIIGAGNATAMLR
ncbi:stage III sporulation protein AE [Proteiniborus ethanoligenes]|uniref:Stage III sporulation protein AE n=1 Tax=Proteiniborus ethanoligenes TaxID=415015 RepID=A0A1H3K9M4_9FIRM|nr:stage III sporulation protein AE [Proteiniborus ethanoligenes]SDY48278.1 stage III sporulation protein AE [Proteiniborus ethanoligenes]